MVTSPRQKAVYSTGLCVVYPIMFTRMRYVARRRIKCICLAWASQNFSWSPPHSAICYGSAPERGNLCGNDRSRRLPVLALFVVVFLRRLGSCLFQTTWRASADSRRRDGLWGTSGYRGGFIQMRTTTIPLLYLPYNVHPSPRRAISPRTLLDRRNSGLVAVLSCSLTRMMALVVPTPRAALPQLFCFDVPPVPLSWLFMAPG